MSAFFRVYKKKLKIKNLNGLELLTFTFNEIYK